jgi:hypothetical protein
MVGTLPYNTASTSRKENMKLTWVKVEPKDIEPQLYWTEKTGWTEKTKPNEAIYLVKQIDEEK